MDRELELEILRERYRKPEFLVIYGKRRVGRTKLVNQAFEGIKHIYLLADRRSDLNLIQENGQIFNDPEVLMVGFR